MRLIDAEHEHKTAMHEGYRCDECGLFVPWDAQPKFMDFVKNYGFCPKCGAKMEVEE